MINESMSILRDANQEWLRIPLPGAEGVYVKVLKADQVDIAGLVEIVPPAA